VHRSLLFVPGDSERKIAKAASFGADILIFDLEDSVAAKNKEAGRAVTREALTQDFGARKYVRVNGLDTGLTDGDLDAVMDNPPETIILPKCASLADIQLLSDKLTSRERERGLAIGTITVLPVATESAVALRNLMRSDWAHPRLTGLMWGAEDISADIGAFVNREDGEYTGVFKLARDVCFLAAREAGVLAIDTPFVNFKDEAACRAECEASYRAGFDGKVAIHPSQVAIINEAFTPNADQIDWAHRVIEALSGGESGVAVLDGQMLDMPHQRNAERILAAAGSSN